MPAHCAKNTGLLIAGRDIFAHAVSEHRGTTITPLGSVSRYTDARLSVVLGTTDVSTNVTRIPANLHGQECNCG